MERDLAVLFRMADNRDPQSAAARFRRARVRRFLELFPPGAERVRILDAGGTPAFWTQHMDALPAQATVTFLNRSFDARAKLPWTRYVAGDARDMHMFRDGEFDVCFSNSVIEHVGNFEDQRRMAAEIRRVAKGYFVQTPNVYFPLEPHFLVPGWQFLPLGVRARLLQKRGWGWMERVRDPELARTTVASIQLLSSTQLRRLFPDGQIHHERMGPLTKSITAWRAL